jgi:tape measure domain-containing protein
MAEAVLELDISPALSAIDDIDEAFSRITADLQSNLDDAFSGLSVDLPDVASTTSDIGQLNSALDQTSSATGRASSNMANFGSSTGIVESAVSRLGGVLRGGITAVAGFTAGFVGIALTKGIQRLTTIEDSVAALTISLGSAAQAGQFVNDILAVVKGTPFNLDQFVEAGKNLVAFNIDAAKVPTVMRAIGEAASASGRGAEAVDQLTYALGKMASQGRVGLDEIYTLQASGVQALEILADGFGVTTEEIRKMISDGAIPADEAIDILSDGILHGTANVRSLGGSMEALRKTLSGSFGGMQAAMARFGAAIVGPFMGPLTAAFRGITDLIDTFNPKITEFFTKIANSAVTQKFTAFFTDLPTRIQPVLDLFKKLGPAIGPIVGLIASIASMQLKSALGPLAFLVPGIGPLVAIFAGLAATSPELRGALADLGATLLPLLKDLVGGFLPALAKVAGWLGTAAAAVVNFINNGIKGLVPALSDSSSWFGRVATIIKDDVIGAFDAVVDFVQAVFVPIWDKIKEVVSNATEAVGGVLESFGIDTETLAASLIEVAGATGVALVGFQLLSPVIGAITGIFEGLSAVFGLIAANPVVAIIAGLAIAFFLAYQNIEPFREAVDGLVDTLVNVFAPVWEETVLPAMRAAWQWIQDNLIPILKEIPAVVGDIVDDLQEKWEILKGIFSGDLELKVGEGGGALQAIGDSFDVVAEAGRALGRGVELVTKALGPLFEKVGSQIAPIMARLGEKFDEIAPKLVKIEKVMIKVVDQALLPFKIGLAAIASSGELVTTVLNSLSFVIIGVIDVIIGAISLLIDVLTGDWAAAWDDVKQIVEGVWNVIRGIIDLALGLILIAIRGVLAVISALWGAAWDAIGGVITGIWNTITSVITGAMNGIWSVITGVIGMIMAIWSAGWNTLTSVVSGAWNTVTSVVSGAISGLWTIVTSGINNIISFFGGVGESIGSALGDLASIIAAPFKAAWNWIAEKWNSIALPKIHVPGTDIDIGGGGLPKLPIILHQGGIVPGPIGKEVLALLQAGERVVPIGDAGTTSTSNIYQIQMPVTIQAYDGMDKNDADELGAAAGAAGAREIRAVIGAL